MNIFVISVIAIVSQTNHQDAPGKSHGSDRDQLVIAVRTAFLANRSILRYGSIKFEYVIGSAQDKTLENDGTVVPEFSGQGLYIFDGLLGRYECVSKQTDNPVIENTKGSNLGLYSVRVLTDGKSTLWDDTRRSTAIAPGADYFYSRVVIPIGLGKPESDELLVQTIDAYSQGKNGCKLDSIKTGEIFDGAEVVHLTFDAPTFRNEFWVDLEKGAIPRQSLAFNKKDDVYIKKTYKDLRYVHDGVWVPFKTSTFFSFGRVKQLNIQDADFDHKPKQADFSLKYPKPVRMNNHAIGVAYEPQEIWDLAKLPHPSTARRLQYSRKQAGLIPNAMPGEREAGLSWPVLVALLGTIALIVQILAVLRRPRHA